VRGTAEAIAAVLATTGGGTAINTAYSERLNATFRSTLAIQGSAGDVPLPARKQCWRQGCTWWGALTVSAGIMTAFGW
jgi:hypothetical protein